MISTGPPDSILTWLAKHMRRVKLPDLLIEVDNQLGFTQNFLTSAQREEPSPEDICAVLAAVMAHGCNLGVYTMAQLTSDVAYDQLKRIGDWHLTEEAQRSALAQLVSAIADLDTSLRWGEGRTAASDGQRFSLPRRVLQQTAPDSATSPWSFILSWLITTPPSTACQLSAPTVMLPLYWTVCFTTRASTLNRLEPITSLFPNHTE
jgi:Tn3 transposase DDE domain